MSVAVGIGELLWDRLPDADRLGGAPFNVVAHLARLGHRAAFATAVGRDELGERALAELRERGIDASFVARVAGVPTGVAEVALAADGTPSFEIASPAAYEQLRLDEPAVAALAALEPAALVIGTLAHARAELLTGTRALAARLPAAVVLYDVNLREGSWSVELVLALAQVATVVKLSEEEARRLGPPLGIAWDDPQRFAEGLAERFELRGVAVTAGARGAALLLDGAFASASPPPVTVADGVGAGDAFAAGLLDAVMRAQDVEATLRRANALGALVASRAGALPDWTPDELVP